MSGTPLKCQKRWGFRGLPWPPPRGSAPWTPAGATAPRPPPHKFNEMIPLHIGHILYNLPWCQFACRPRVLSQGNCICFIPFSVSMFLGTSLPVFCLLPVLCILTHLIPFSYFYPTDMDEIDRIQRRTHMLVTKMESNFIASSTHFCIVHHKLEDSSTL